MSCAPQLSLRAILCHSPWLLFALGVFAAGIGHATEPKSAAEAELTHALIGAVGLDYVHLWARCSAACVLHWELQQTDQVDRAPRLFETASSGADRDFTVSARMDGLKEGTNYSALVQVQTRGSPRRLSFRTLRRHGDLSFVFGSCLNIRPFTALREAAAASPAFILLLGDQIYADHRDEDDPARPFLADPQAVAAADEDTLLQLYWSKYRRNFADQGFRNAAETVPLFMVWDDHELVNDFAGERTTPLYRAARRAYEAYQHGHNPDSADVGELYYVIRASEELEIFVLDGRSFRSEGRVEQPRSLLGRKQRERLLRWLLESRAAVKVIASPVMWADQARFSLNERGAPYLDSWYLFADEREHILRFVLANRVHGVVLISGDAHWAAAYRFERRAEGARYTFVELSASPLAHVGLATPVVPRDAAASMTSELLASFRPSPPAPGEPLGGFYGSAELFSNGSLRLALCATPGRRVLFEMLLQPHELRVQDDGASHYDQAHVRRGAERERDGGQGPAAQSSVDRTHAGLRLAAGAGILVLVSVIALRVVFHAMLRPRQTKEKS